MELKIIKKTEMEDNSKLDIKSLKDKKLKVGAYVRVSTEEEIQNFSFSSQYKHYYKVIEENPNWSFAGIYAEKGKSGTRTEKRVQFITMIKSALNGEIDLILTKSISRFARNTVDTLKYVRKLKEKNVGVYFEEEKINTLDMTGELLLTILSSIAQQESQNISAHITMGHRMKMKKGEFSPSDALYGYLFNYETRKYEIVEDEAVVVREIYNRFASGEAITSITKSLNERKEPKNRERFSSRWHYGHIHSILSNEKYAGNLLLGKTYTPDPMTHKPVINNGEREMFYIKNSHDAIVSQELFDKVQVRLKKVRDNHFEMFKKDVFADTIRGKIYCSTCNNPKVTMRVKNPTRKYNMYMCKYETKDNPCKGFNIKRNDLEKIVVQSFILLKEYLNKEKLLEFEQVEEILNNTKLGKTFNREIFEKLYSKIFVGEYKNGILNVKLLIHNYLNHGGVKDEIQLSYKSNFEYRKRIDHHIVFLKIPKVKIIVCFEEEDNGSI